jgi:hypothetical protein
MLRRVALVRTISPIIVALMKEELSSFETLILTRVTLRNISEDSILHSRSSENLKSYKESTGFISILTYFISFDIHVYMTQQSTVTVSQTRIALFLLQTFWLTGFQADIFLLMRNTRYQVVYV